jgi:hypothetical protein
MRLTFGVAAACGRRTENDLGGAGLSGRCSDDHQSLHPAGAAFRFRACRPAICHKRIADAGRDDRDLCRGRDTGRGCGKLGGQRQSIWPHRRDRAFGAVRADTALPRSCGLGDAALRSSWRQAVALRRRRGSLEEILDRFVFLARCGDRILVGAVRGSGARPDPDGRGPQRRQCRHDVFTACLARPRHSLSLSR